MSRIGPRRKARQMVLQMLFQCEVGQHSPEHVLTTFFQGTDFKPEQEKFSRALFGGTLEKLEKIDLVIQKHTEHWRLERMVAIDRNLLRLAVYELLYTPDTPPAVAINEALELACEFSTGESVKFINVVLDAVCKALQPTSTSS